MTRAAWPVLVLAIACTKHVDGDKLGAAITAGLAKDLKVENLSCPGDRPFEKDDHFACKGTTAEGQPITVTVTQKDAEGNVQWTLDGMTLHADKVRTEILPKLGSGYEVACPHEVAVVAVGDWTTCTLSKDGVRSHLKVRIDDVEGNESFQAEP